jgi:hypothetical protein
MREDEELIFKVERYVSKIWLSYFASIAIIMNKNGILDVIPLPNIN